MVFIEKQGSPESFRIRLSESKPHPRPQPLATFPHRQNYLEGRRSGHPSPSLHAGSALLPSPPLRPPTQYGLFVTPILPLPPSLAQNSALHDPSNFWSLVLSESSPDVCTTPMP